MSALKAVAVEEEEREVKRGPPSASRAHWHSPRKHTEPGSRALRWKFQCRYCNKYVSANLFECLNTHRFGPSRPRTRTVERTARCDDFDDEKPQPKIGNLGTHTRTDHPNEYAGGNGSAQELLTNPIDSGYTPASAKLMEEFLAKG